MADYARPVQRGDSFLGVIHGYSSCPCAAQAVVNSEKFFLLPKSTRLLDPSASSSSDTGVAPGAPREVAALQRHYVNAVPESEEVRKHSKLGGDALSAY